MGFLDDMKANRMGQKAYNVHVQANDLQKRGKLSEARKKYPEALQLYAEAYEAGCRKTSILMAYAVLLMRSGEFERARELMREISKDKSMSEDTHFELRINYAICLWRLGILDKAIETAEFAGKHAKNGSYYSTLGTLLVDRAKQDHDFESVKKFLDEAMEYDDEDPATLDNMGELVLLMSDEARASGNIEEADALRKQSVEYYEKAHEEKPGQITTLYALAKFERENGNIERAKELVDKAIVHSSSKVCPISIEMLKELKAQLE